MKTVGTMYGKRLQQFAVIGYSFKLPYFGLRFKINSILLDISLCNERTFFVKTELVSYWDQGNWKQGGCGPYSHRYNWDWCWKGCKQEVVTNVCPDGTAKLKTVEGDPDTTIFKKNYQLDDCWFAYYATYTCSDSGIQLLNFYRIQNIGNLEKRSRQKF